MIFFKIHMDSQCEHNVNTNEILIYLVQGISILFIASSKVLAKPEKNTGVLYRDKKFSHCQINI